MIFDYYDTSALLASSDLVSANTIYVSSIVLGELENIKTSARKDEEIKFRARQLVRALICETEKYHIDAVPMAKLEKIRKKNPLLQPIADHYILCEAEYLIQKGHFVNFFTSDGCLYLIAKKVFPSMKVFYLGATENTCSNEIWAGWGKYYPTNSEFASLYSNSENNILKAVTNQYCSIYDGNDLKDIFRWNGEEYQKLDYKIIRNSSREKVGPLNIEQKMLFDLLQNRKIPVKLTVGTFGSGKSYIMLAHALRYIQDGLFDKLVFIRNNVSVKDTVDLGSKAPLYSNI